MEETLRIERMGNGAEAVGRLASGKTVFVAGGAPGDAVRVEVVEEKASFARARIVAVEEPSPLRAEPRCPHGDACGGCPWQHLSYEAQLEAKRANVVGALVHTARLEAVRAEDLVRPCLPSKRQWGYRNKLELGAARAENGEFLLGFHREGTHEIATPAVCPLAHDAVAKAPKALRGALRFAQGSADLGIFRVGVRHSVRTRETEIALWTKPGAFPRAHVAKTLKSALKATSIVRVLADPGRARKIKGVETLDGKGCWGEELADARFLTSAPSFFQVNTAQAEKLAAEVVEGLGGRMGEEGPEGLDGLLVADLYAGGGTFSVPLARAGADVIAIEAAGSSVRDLRRNAEMRGHRGGGRRRRPRAARAGRAGRARGGPAARRPRRRRGGEHRRGGSRARGLRELQPRHLGARCGPLRAKRLPPGARATRGPVPPDAPCGGGEPVRAGMTLPPASRGRRSRARPPRGAAARFCGGGHVRRAFRTLSALSNAPSTGA